MMRPIFRLSAFLFLLLGGVAPPALAQIYEQVPATVLGLNVKTYGAIGNGTTDDTASIQAAINAASALGLPIILPVGTYKITSTLTLGSGSPGAQSTVSNVLMMGYAPYSPIPAFGFTEPPNQSKLVWAGGAAPMIKVLGPIQGWGIKNMMLDCASIAGATGISPVSAQFGSGENLYIKNCMTGIGSTTVTAIPGGLSNADSLRNEFHNVAILTPDISGSIGVLLTNAQNGVAADTDFNHFDNLTIILGVTGAHAGYGIYLTNCDDNLFENVHMFGGGGSAVAVGFDYTSTGVWPAGNTISHIDVATLPFANVGTPSGAAAANYLNNVSQTNAGVYPLLANLIVDHASGSWTPVLTATSGTPTYSTHIGKYTVNGWDVTAHFSIVTTALGSLTGNVIIQGLPLAVGGSGLEEPGSCTFARMTGITLDTGYTVLSGDASIGNTWINLLENGSTKTFSALPATTMAAATTIEGTCVYHR